MNSTPTQSRESLCGTPLPSPFGQYRAGRAQMVKIAAEGGGDLLLLGIVNQEY